MSNVIKHDVKNQKNASEGPFAEESDQLQRTFTTENYVEVSYQVNEGNQANFEGHEADDQNDVFYPEDCVRKLFGNFIHFAWKKGKWKH